VNVCVIVQIKMAKWIISFLSVKWTSAAFKFTVLEFLTVWFFPGILQNSAVYRYILSSVVVKLN